MTPEPPVALNRHLELDLLRPALAGAQLSEGCRDAMAAGLAAVLVPPCDAGEAARLLEGSPVELAAAVAAPYGWASTATKLYETRDLARRGVREVHVWLNLGQLVERRFQAVEMEVLQLARAAHESGARLRVRINETRLDRTLLVIATRIAKRGEADSASCENVASLADVLAVSKGQIEVALGCAVSGAEALQAVQAGAVRIGAAAAAAMAADWQARLENGPEVISSGEQ